MDFAVGFLTLFFFFFLVSSIKRRRAGSNRDGKFVQTRLCVSLPQPCSRLLLFYICLVRFFLSFSTAGVRFPAKHLRSQSVQNPKRRNCSPGGFTRCKWKNHVSDFHLCVQAQVLQPDPNTPKSMSTLNSVDIDFIEGEDKQTSRRVFVFIIV